MAQLVPIGDESRMLHQPMHDNSIGWDLGLDLLLEAYLELPELIVKCLTLFQPHRVSPGALKHMQPVELA